MKKISCLLAVLALAGCQKEVPKEYVVFSGKITHPNSEKVFVNGHDLNEEFSISKDGTFIDSLKISEPGYYTFRIGRESSVFYLKNGADIHLNIDTEEFDESITYEGAGAPENNYLAKKYLASEKVTTNGRELYAMEEAAFVSKIDSLTDALKKALTTAKVSEDFKTLEEKNLMYDKYALLYNYIDYYPQLSGNFDYKPSDKITKSLENIDLDNETDAQAYDSYAGLVIRDYNEKLGNVTAKELPEKSVTLIRSKNSSKVKEILMTEAAYEVKPGNEEASSYYFDQFSSMSENQEFKDMLLKRYELVKKLSRGTPSPSFEYENYKGGNLALEDLKGKYVYIDVWATWCGPCRQEIPFLKEIEEEYKGKKIDFVSISVDSPADHETWKTFVKEQQLGGIQLYADKKGEDQFIERYNVEFIPRFILIDPDGKIVNASAPRPSEPALKELFDSLSI